MSGPLNAAITRELGIASGTLCAWVERAAIAAGEQEAIGTEECEEPEISASRA